MWYGLFSKFLVDARGFKALVEFCKVAPHEVGLVSMCILCLYFSGCASYKSEVATSLVSSVSDIALGETATLTWRTIANDPEDLSITLDGQPVEPIGTLEVTPTLTKSRYTLLAYLSGRVVSSSEVDIKIRSAEGFASPVSEEISSLPSPYVRGLINFENVLNQSDLSLDVIGYDVSQFPSKVRVLVSIRDRYGNSVANLAPPYNYRNSSFWKGVYDNTYLRDSKLGNLTVREYRQVDRQPKSIGLVADYSGSMMMSIGKIEDAIDLAVNSMSSEDDYNLVQFDHNVFMTISGAKGGASLPRFPFGMLGGGTAFYAGSVTCLETLKFSQKEKVAILFTDGVDNSSIYNTANEIAQRAFRHNVRVFVIGFGSADTRLLRDIAQNCNGKVYLPRSLAELTPIYDEIFRTMQVYYALEFNSNATGKRHLVTLEVQPTAEKTLRVMSAFVESPEPLIEKDRPFLAAQFQSGGVSFSSEAWSKHLDLLVNKIKEDPLSTILIRAHSDTRGPAELNQKLSLDRARRIQDELIKRGIVKARIAIEAVGEGEPLHPYDAENWQSQENRRAELIVR